MNCTVTACAGQYEAREVTRTVRAGDRLIVVTHIPAEVCAACGDTLFTPATIEQLEALGRSTAPPQATVPLYDFAGAPT